jgi:hypothetical protein
VIIASDDEADAQRLRTRLEASVCVDTRDDVCEHVRLQTGVVVHMLTHGAYKAGPGGYHQVSSHCLGDRMSVCALDIVDIGRVQSYGSSARWYSRRVHTVALCVVGRHVVVEFRSARARAGCGAAWWRRAAV